MSIEDDNVYAEDIANMGFGQRGAPYGLVSPEVVSDPNMSWGYSGAPLQVYGVNGGGPPDPGTSTRRETVIINVIF
jgi:hypothetical protein